MQPTAARNFRLGTALLVLGLSGCSNAPLPSLSTGSLFGSKPDAVAAAAKPEPKNDPTTRTLQVSRIAARAQRCGFNFDAAKLKGNFMAAEGAQPGSDVAQLGKLDSVYNSSFAGTLKAITKEGDYCSDARTTHIKAELARHLAGDYTPGTAFKDPNAGDSGGILDNMFGNNGGESGYKSPTLPTNNL